MGINKKNFIVHGIEFERTGECNQCGGCDHECSACPHGEFEGGKWNCKLHDPDTRGEVCEICTNNPESPWYQGGKEVTHQICIDFPNHPWLNVVRSGKCCYEFKRTDKVSMDDTIFMDGKFIKE